MLKINLTKREKWLILIFVASFALGLVVLTKKPATRFEPVQPFQEDVAGTAPTTGSTARQSEFYSQLVKDYEGNRIQFDANCQAIPNNITVKNGAKIMFDNRSGDARRITVGGIAYNFPSYGYKILTLSSKTWPKTLLLSCGAAVNVGQILIQK